MTVEQTFPCLCCVVIRVFFSLSGGGLVGFFFVEEQVAPNKGYAELGRAKNT